MSDTPMEDAPPGMAAAAAAAPAPAPPAAAAEPASASQGATVPASGPSASISQAHQDPKESDESSSSHKRARLGDKAGAGVGAASPGRVSRESPMSLWLKRYHESASEKLAATPPSHVSAATQQLTDTLAALSTMARVAPSLEPAWTKLKQLIQMLVGQPPAPSSPASASESASSSMASIQPVPTAALNSPTCGTVVVIGLSEAGKSMLLNALFGSLLLSTDPLTEQEERSSVTFCPTEFEHEASLPKDQVLVTIEFLTAAALEQRALDLQALANGDQNAEADKASVAKALADAQKAKKLLAELKIVQTTLRDHRGGLRLSFQCDASRFGHKLKKCLLGNQLGPKKQSIDLRLGVARILVRTPLCPRWVRFVDLPGVEDSDPTRASIADRYLPGADHLAVVIKGDKRDAADEAFGAALRNIAHEILALSSPDAVDRLRACTLVLTQLDRIQEYTKGATSDSDSDSDFDAEDELSSAEHGIAEPDTALPLTTDASDSDSDCCDLCPSGLVSDVGSEPPALEGLLKGAGASSSSSAGNQNAGQSKSGVGSPAPTHVVSPALIKVQSSANASAASAKADESDATMSPAEAAQTTESTSPDAGLPHVAPAAGPSPASADLLFLDRITPRVNAIKSATRTAMLDALESVYWTDPAVLKFRFSQSVDSFRIVPVSAKDFLKLKGAIQFSEYEKPKLTETDTGIEDLLKFFTKSAVERSPLRVGVFTVCNLLTQHVEVVQSQQSKQQALLQPRVTQLNQLQAAIKQRGDRLVQELQDLAKPQKFVFPAPENLCQFGWSVHWKTLEKNLKTPKWLASEILIRLRRSIPLSSELKKAVDAFGVGLIEDFSAASRGLPKPVTRALQSHQITMRQHFARVCEGSRLNIFVFAGMFSQFDDPFATRLRKVLETTLAPIMHKCVAPAVHPGSGYLSRMIARILTEFKTVYVQLQATIVAELAKEMQQRVDECQTILTEQIESTERICDSLLQRRSEGGSVVEDKDHCDTIIKVQDELLRLAGSNQNELLEWTTMWNNLATEALASAKLEASFTVRHMYVNNRLSGHHLLADGFYYIPWTWPRKHGLDPLADLRAVPFAKGVGMEIMVYDSTASQDTSKRLGQVIEEIKKHFETNQGNEQTAEVRTLWLANRVDQLCGGKEARTQAGAAETKKRLHAWRQNHNTNVIDIGTLIDEIKLGVCRHRAMLFKFLADLTDREKLHSTAPDRGIILAHVYRGRYVSTSEDPGDLFTGGGHVWNIVELGRPRLLDIMHNPTKLKDAPEAYMGTYQRGGGKQPPVGTAGALSDALRWKRLECGDLASQVKLSPATSKNVLGSGRLFKVVRGLYDGKNVAIKMPLVTLQSAIAKARPLLLREANALHLLHQTGVVPRLFGAINVEDRLPSSSTASSRLSLPAVVMELLDDYKELREEKTWKRVIETPLVSRLRIACLVADSLSECAQRSILHSDVGSHNILIGPEMQVRLIDFHLSAYILSKEAPIHGMQQGVEPYVAPEMLTSPKGAKSEMKSPFAADVFSFGVILLELSRGKIGRLEPTATWADMLELARTLAPSSLNKLIRSCVNYGPNSRPSILTVVTELREIIKQLELEEQASSINANNESDAME